MKNTPSNSGNVTEDGSDHSATQDQGQPKQNVQTKKNESLGVALVGLGSYSEKQLAPALKETKHCHLAGVVSGDSEKLKKWRRQYNLQEKNLYGYENFDDIKSNDDMMTTICQYGAKTGFAFAEIDEFAEFYAIYGELCQANGSSNGTIGGKFSGTPPPPLPPLTIISHFSRGESTLNQRDNTGGMPPTRAFSDFLSGFSVSLW